MSSKRYRLLIYTYSLLDSSYRELSANSFLQVIHSLEVKGWLQRRNGEIGCHQIIRDIIFSDVTRHEAYISGEITINIRHYLHSQGHFFTAFLTAISRNKINKYLFNRHKDAHYNEFYINVIADLGNLQLSSIALIFINQANSFYAKQDLKTQMSYLVEAIKIYRQNNDELNFKLASEKIAAYISDPKNVNKENTSLLVKYYTSIAAYQTHNRPNLKKAQNNFKTSLDYAIKFKSSFLEKRAYENLISFHYIHTKSYKKAWAYAEKYNELISFKNNYINDHPFDASVHKIIGELSKKMKKLKKLR